MMQNRAMLILGLGLWPLAAPAAECPDLGVANAYLAQMFCDQLNGIVATEPATRGVTDGNDQEPEAAEMPPWAGFPLLKDAYRADPQATLELIARIKNAGGLPES